MDLLLHRVASLTFGHDTPPRPLSFFFFNDTATTEIYTLSLHDALPICSFVTLASRSAIWPKSLIERRSSFTASERSEEPRLNSSHSQISYAVFCLKKKNNMPLGRYSTVSLDADADQHGGGVREDCVHSE